jgi:hypothetical protein
MQLEHSKINQLRALIEWARITLNKAANLDVSFWSHAHNDGQTIEYRIWIDSVFHKASKDLDYLVYLIPSIKDFCLQNCDKEIAS